jgi:hypothetical protein
VPADGYNAETYIAVCELLINGFDIAPNQWFDKNVQPDIVANTEHFDGLRPDQVALGVVSEGHGTGELSPSEYADIVDKLTEKYPTFRGFMTWSIGNIAKQGLNTLDAVRPILDKWNESAPEIPIDEPIFGDVNSDGTVDSMDIRILKEYVSGSTVPGIAGADLSGDGVVNSIDISLLKNIILTTSS